MVLLISTMVLNITQTNHFIETNGVRLHVVAAGPERGPLVILLHGFPEFWFSWHKQIPALAEAGFHVLTPDQRGYNLSDKPRGIAAYNLDELAEDVIGLIQNAGQRKACLIGHDLGGSVAWWTANKYPAYIEKLAVLNAPHHTAMKRRLRRHLTQLRKSWYIFFFQIPFLPEACARAFNWRTTVRALVQSSRPNVFSPEDLKIYRQAWSQPGAMSCMINWYRAILQNPPQRLPSRRITVPTLLIWGVRDNFLGRELAPRSLEFCDQGRLVFIEEATHWVQHEETCMVNRLLLRFLKEETDGGNPAG
jgi:pimeloyl-ACP methyl ester carboxylesterase